MSASKNYETVLALRILIGCSQAFMQGISLYGSLWYKRDEMATRNGKLTRFILFNQHFEDAELTFVISAAIIYWSATMSGAFSGLIAYGVGNDLTLDKTGKEPWRWLFIIEGAIAGVVGGALWLWLPAFPENIKGKHWLFTSNQLNLAKERSCSE